MFASCCCGCGFGSCVAVLVESTAIAAALVLCIMKFSKQDDPFRCARGFLRCRELMASSISLAVGSLVSVDPLAPRELICSCSICHNKAASFGRSGCD